MWIAIALPFALASCLLISWAADIEDLRRFGLASMSPLTALAFLTLSLGLALREYGRPKRSALPAVLIASGGLIGAIKLFDLATGNPRGIDALLFASRLSLTYAQPSRIAPNTALGFVLLSSALLLMTHRAERVVVAAQLAAIGTGVIAVFALVGHLYSVNAFYARGVLHLVAAPTAVSFLCLATFALARTSRRGLIVPLSDRGPAGRTSRALLPAAFIIPVSFEWLRQQTALAGLAPGEVGIALMVMLTMLTLMLIIWLNARWLLASDTLRLKAEAQIAHMAHHDFLTGLPNRAQFMDILIKRMAERPRPGIGFAIFMMDIDDLKQVNDRLGHAAGDAFLRLVGNHLQNCHLRRDDLVARIGGDEFAMLLDAVGNTEDAASVAARVVDGMPSLFGAPGHTVPVGGISVGIVVSSQHHLTPEAMLADADRALYDAKRNGKGRFAFYPADRPRVPSQGPAYRFDLGYPHSLMPAIIPI